MNFLSHIARQNVEFVFYYRKITQRILKRVILLFIFMMDKMFFIVKSLSAVIPGRLFPLSNRNPDLEKMIVVAIDNDGVNRMNEYSAWK